MSLHHRHFVVYCGVDIVSPLVFYLPCYILIRILSFDFVLTNVSLFQGVSAGPLPPQVPADSVPLDLSGRAAAPAAVPPPGPLHAPPVCLPQVGPC